MERMRRVLIWIGSFIVLGLLSLRYKIEVKGLDHLKKNKGILFLPNHPAEIEPIMLYNLLARKFHPHPVVIEHFYYLKGARGFMDLIGAFPMPNFEFSANSWKIRQVEKCLEIALEELQKGENFLIYPSGQLKREGHENIGGSSFIHTLLERSPDTQVVLVRTSGLWGSGFSCAFTGNSPDFWKVLKEGMKTVLKNGIFFTPRRKVTIEFEMASADFPRQGTRREQNEYLENWYNRYFDDQGRVVKEEPLRLVSYSLFSKEVPKIRYPKKDVHRKKKAEISDEIRKDLYQELKRLSGVKEIGEDMDLSRDLGLDSLDLASIYAFIDERFEIEGTEVGTLKTVNDLLLLIAEGKIGGGKESMKHLELYEWPREPLRPSIQFPEGKTIPECFLAAVDRMGKSIACMDEMTPPMSYQKMKLAILLIARKLKTIPDERIGVLLPSTVGCNLIILSILFAGKVPVMLNWTAGERSLNFAKDLLDLKIVLSSRRFLERVDVLELGTLETHLILLEDFRKELSLWDKLMALYLSKRSNKNLSKKFALDRIQEEDPAVILFTSGTENYPKAVPLSHKNILNNEREALTCAKFYKEDILYGVLPPFHSFGLSVTGILPLLIGLKVFYAPDPTDTHAMARDCFQRRISLLCCAPSFYRNLFRVAKKEQISSVRLMVAGAEKTPQELFDKAHAFGKEMIEGYGITECSPIVTINRQEDPPKGVGKPLPGVELCIIHPETGEKLPDEKEGEICIRGKSVFKGYLGKEAPNPFIEIEGKRWYRSGDLGHIDPDGSLILAGRLKRFVKIGGEMVSLVALEEELTSYAEKKGLIHEEEPQLAIGVKEGDKPALILFTTFDFKKEEGNEALKEGGFPRIVKLAAVYKIDAIPLSGTGKVQLRRIQEFVNEKHG